MIAGTSGWDSPVSNDAGDRRARDLLRQREYDMGELADLERRLRALDNGYTRQAQPEPPGRPYRASLVADIERLRKRLASESA